MFKFGDRQYYFGVLMMHAYLSSGRYLTFV